MCLLAYPSSTTSRFLIFVAALLSAGAFVVWLLHNEATFRDSRDVVVDVYGDPDEAGFVQVIQGRGSDPARARELMGQNSVEWAEFRPDVIGSVAVKHDGGTTPALRI